MRKPSARKAEPAAKPLAATKPAASKPEPASKAVPPLKPVPATKHVRIAKKVATRAGRGSTASAPAVSEPVPAPSIEPKPKASPRGRSVPKIEPLELETVSNPDGGAGSASTAPLGRSRGLERERGSSSPLKHSFHLRPGVRVEIELPENVTVSEVDRFCSFLKTIPFAGD
ncbi:MAG TPA: hypothetical protein VMG12_40130 [Polyangiaceae bacterium]|nr:hypothetical protein [Polyangiaceae bacterium]